MTIRLQRKIIREYFSKLVSYGFKPTAHDYNSDYGIEAFETRYSATISKDEITITSNTDDGYYHHEYKVITVALGDPKGIEKITNAVLKHWLNKMRKYKNSYLEFDFIMLIKIYRHALAAERRRKNEKRSQNQGT